MLTLGQSLVGKKVLSLRTGAPVGEIIAPIINPNNLKIEGWATNDRFHKRKSVLLSQDIRDILPQGFAVNDHDALTDPDELIRLKEVLETNFELIGKLVVTVGKKRLGKVNDFAFDKNDSFIQKLYVSTPLIKSLSGGGNIIDRSQIVEITHKKIVVKEAIMPINQAVEAEAQQSSSPAPAIANIKRN